MQVTFSTVKAEYEALAARAQYTSPEKSAAILSVCRKKIIPNAKRYLDVTARCGVPALWLAVINHRESGTDFSTYLGNGDPYTRVTTHVPKGRGPFRAWEDGAVDATTYDHVGRPGPEGWTMPWFLYRCEAWNGFGPRLHGRRTGYLWAGATVYDKEPGGGGKYVADGVWSPTTYDAQLGCWPLAKTLLQLAPEFARGLDPAFDIDGVAGTAEPIGALIANDAQLTGVRWLQDALNEVQGAGLLVDGSYGRHTRAAVRQFQATHDLFVDGQAGDKTCAALDAALLKMQNTGARPTDVLTVAPVIVQAKPATVSPVPPPMLKGAVMEFDRIVSLASFVAPGFAAKLVTGNPFLPVAINFIGTALGGDGPHTTDSVGAAAATKPADELAAALKKAAAEYAVATAKIASEGAGTVYTPSTTPAILTHAPVAVEPAPTSPALNSGGLLVDQVVSGGLHVLTAIGGVIAGSGFLDPSGPLSSLTTGRPWLGLALAVASAVVNHFMVKASNTATKTWAK